MVITTHKKRNFFFSQMTGKTAKAWLPFKAFRTSYKNLDINSNSDH